MEPRLSRRALFGRAPAPVNAPPAGPLLAIIAAHCLAETGAYCRTCGDACPEAAIRFLLQPRGRARADVDGDRCTGCGDCLSPCPVGAIQLAPRDGDSA
jgi:ferredoxin-type protein NapF